MIDPKTYIESGVLELYVLGDLSSEEKREVEEMAVQHPEIRSELEAIESALEAYALANAIQPSARARGKVLGSLVTAQSSDSSNEPVIVPLQPVARSTNFYKYAFAASVALLVISGVMLVNLNNQLNESNTQLIALQTANQQFSNRVNFMDQELQDSRKFLEIYQKPEQYKLVSLKGTPNAPQASMTVAFNPDKQEVMIDLSSLKMPSNDEQHQYQLWALVDGKPVDLGVFDSTTEVTGMKIMKSVKGPQTFAVTLEPKGGSAGPTMEQMMVLGDI